MAPPLEYDKEPKAPDKSAATISNDDSKLQHSIVNDQQPNSDHKPANSAANTEVENNKQVVNLDDGQLRALLDEAMNYKCPKDLEGKSNLFKELLEEVQQDEQQDGQAGAGAARLPARGARGGGRGRSQLLQSNSLQDLVAALAAEPPHAGRRARPHPPAPAPVSARAIQGGSLPSGVDTSFLLGEEPSGARGAGYLATVRCVNPPPLAERRVSASDANGPAEPELLHRRSKPVFPVTYTARATLEIGSGAVCSGRAVTTTTASNQGDSAIPFSCISSPEVVATCAAPPTAVAVDPKPLQLGSGYRAVASLTGGEPRAARAPPDAPHLQVFVPRLGLQPRGAGAAGFNGLPLARPGGAAVDEYKKSLDENGNAVQGFSSPVSGSSQHKKPRRKKSSKNETVIKSDQIDGYKGDKDLNEVLRFIESHAEHGRKLPRKHDDDKGKKRSAERRKPAEKPQRASSLEELSRTSLADLTQPPPKPERRSWDARPFRSPPPDPAPPELDFQTVTKRRRARRRADEPPPPADSDRDSVHSLPEPRAPAASYADIARTRHNIPDLIESCNYYAEGEAEAAGDAEYPALPRLKAPPRRERKPPESAAPDVLAGRPAVILLAAAAPADMDGVTFGFDINEQLLGAPARRPRCDLVRDALAAPAASASAPAHPAPAPADPAPAPATPAAPALLASPAPQGATVVVGAGCALRYVAPAPPDARLLMPLVDYVGHAWEDVVRCGAGKVRYFSE